MWVDNESASRKPYRTDASRGFISRFTRIKLRPPPFVYSVALTFDYAIMGRLEIPLVNRPLNSCFRKQREEREERSTEVGGQR